MTIKTSRNLDEIKPGGVALLSKRQIKYSILTLIATVLVTVIATKLGVPSTISGYIGLIVAAPIGYIGFFKRNGMDLKEYRQAKKNVNQPMLFYSSTECPDTPIITSERKDTVAHKGMVERIISNMMKKKEKGGEQSA